MAENRDASADESRYARQIRYVDFGWQGQQSLSQATVAIVGCGALGSVQASTLTRAGVGRIQLIDRDFLELNNLQRQVLYDEQDVAKGLPKAIAAAEKLRLINSQIDIEAVVEDLNFQNIRRLCGDATVILDGTDNFETRFLINDFAVAEEIPWVYGGCIGCDGQTMTILPGQTPCLHCLMIDGPPPAGTAATCDTAGILSPIINVIAAIQCSEAIKIIAGQVNRINRKLISIGLWDNSFRQLDLGQLRERANCPVCQGHQFRWLNGERSSASAVLCGRNAVQLMAAESQVVDLEAMEKRLSSVGTVRRNQFLVQLETDEYFLTLFPDGRVIIKGTEDIAKAKSLYSQWVGN